jgi:SAM-dependent methyltransferase
MRHWLFVFAIACGSSSSSPQPVVPQPAPLDHGHAAHVHHGPGGHRFEKADDWAPMFDDPKRDEWQRPDAVVAALSLAPGMAVADVGAGTGYFESRLAAAVGSDGKVLAVDIEPDMVRYLGERATRENTPQVRPLLGTATDPKLPGASLDRILVVDTWHHVEGRVDYARKLAGALKPGGAIFIVDFTLESERGPPKAHRLAGDRVRAELEQAGLRATVVDVGLPDQYMIKAELAR